MGKELYFYLKSRGNFVVCTNEAHKLAICHASYIEQTFKPCKFQLLFKNGRDIKTNKIHHVMSRHPSQLLYFTC